MKKVKTDIASKQTQMKKQEEEQKAQAKIDKAKRAKATIKVADNKSLSIEPSYMSVEKIRS